MLRTSLALGLVALGGLSCQTVPAPLGEALVVVNTDVAIPKRINRVRVDVLSSVGAVLETREIVTPSTEDWPLSFSVVLPDGLAEGDVLVRLRASPEGYELPQRELARIAAQRPRDRVVYGSIDEACAAAPALRLTEPLTLRRGPKVISPLLQAQGCTEETRSGAAVAKLEIAEQGDYQVEVTRAVPNAANAEPGSDTAISLRSDCRFATTQLACAERISAGNRLSRIERVTLAPGTYWVVTGGSDEAPADLTLRASRLDVIQPVPDPPVDPEGSAELESPPGVTIDRLVIVHLRSGERGSIGVTLRGECFGVPVDLATRASCIDVAGVASPVPVVSPVAALTREAAPVRPWVGDEPVPCSGAPAAHEVCVPGGGFLLGDNLALEDLDRRAQPARMRVVAPFFMDKLEMSVGRFREARQRGFVPPGDSPLRNTSPGIDAKIPFGLCTYSDEPLGRESYPVNCVTWTTARALCNFLGGDLPTEEQWEFAATAAGRLDETPYPWGREPPTCARTIFGRSGAPGALCSQAPVGPVPADDPLLVAGDVSPLGIVGLAGNMEEMLATAFIPYSDPAWTRAGLRGPVDEVDAPLRSSRGGDWSGGSLYSTASTRRAEPIAARLSNVGFRCARPGR